MPALIPLGSHTGKPPIPLRRPVLLIGSRNIAHLHLLSSKVSKAHALIINSDGKIYIRDLASRTHVYVNGEQVREADLKHNDLIKIGSFVFRLAIPAAWQTRPRDSKADPAQLEVEGAELPVRLDQRVTLIGRRPTCDVSLLEDSASTAHAVIFEMGGRRFIRDLGSRTGTFVNGRTIHQEELSFGDVIRIGETEFRYAPAPAMPVGPVPADEIDTDLDELEDLVGTAPLMEEPPEVIAKRLEQEQEERQVPARPATPMPVSEKADSRAPIPLDDELDLETESAPPPADEEEDLPLQPIEAPAPAADVSEPIPLADEPPTVAPAQAEEEDQLPLAPQEPAQQEQADAEPEPAAEADLELEPQPEAAANDGFAGLDLEDEQADDQQADLPPTEVEIDLASDLELEAEPHEHDPEATRALPPEPTPRARRTPAISDDIVDEPVVAQPEAEESEESDLPIEEEAEVDHEPAIADAAGDTVALAAAALADAPQETEDTDSNMLDLAPADEPQAADQPAVDEDELPLAPVSDIDDQTVEPTLPTPESAQSLEPAIPVSEDPAQAESLTDTGFDREVHAFVAESPEPVEEVVETTDDQPQTIATSEDDLQAVTEDHHDHPADDLAEDYEEETPEAEAESTDLPPLDLDLTDEAETPVAEDEPSEQPAQPVTIDEVAEEAPAEEALEPAPAPQAEVPETPAPAPEEHKEGEQFTPGVNQWGFLGGSPLILTGLPTPPPPARAGRATPRASQEAPFGKQPLPVDDLAAGEVSEISDVSDPFAGTPGGTLPQISEIDVFSQLGAPPDDDPLFGAAALGHVKATGSTQPEIPPIDAEDSADAAASSEHDDNDDLDDEFHDHDEDDADPQWEQPAAAQPVAAQPVANDAQADEDADDPFADLDIEDAATAESADEAEEDDLAEATADDQTPADQPAAEQAAEPKPVRKPVIPPPASRNGAKPPTVLFDQPKPRRKRRWFFTVPSLFLMMLLAAAAAAGAIWYTIPAYGIVTGWIEFSNLNALPGPSRTTFYQTQAHLLADTNTQEVAATRETAKGKLNTLYRGTSPGFLDDPQRYAFLVDRSSRTWADAADGRLTLQLSDSSDPHGDRQRLHALLLALYDRNSRLIDARNNLVQQKAVIDADLSRMEKEIAVMQDRLAHIRADGDRPPTMAELSAVKRDVERLEAEWRAAEDAARAVQSELERMREVAARDAAAQQDGNAAAVAVDDPELQKMQEALERLNQQLQVASVADNLEIERTRRAMDTSIAQLEHQIEQVKKQMADVPEMKEYVTVARLLQDTTHQITNELIHSQRQQIETINSLKRKLDEQLVARQNEIWENDPDLKNLTALLEIQRRHYNAAIASDHRSAKQNTDELAASIAQLEKQIEERRRVLGNDLIYADVIRGLQELIAASQRRLEEDQKRAEQQIARMQQALADAAPDLQKLPEEQKKLAAELERRLVEMNDARKAYSDALARATADGDAQRRELESQALELKARIDARRQDLLAARLKALGEQEQHRIRTEIQAKTDQLNKLQAAARDAWSAFTKRRDDQIALETRAQNIASWKAESDRLIRELADLKATFDQLQQQKASVEEQLAVAVYPIEPAGLEQHVSISEVRDDRPMYAFVAVCGVALLFGSLMLFAHHAHTRETAVSHRVTESEPPLFPSRDTIDDLLTDGSSSKVEEPTTA